MKRTFNWMVGAVALIFAFIALPHQQAKAQPGVSVSFQMFYDELSPYGQWIDDPQYGYVWAPEVDNNFRPYYTNGRWVMTEYGNTWISDYNWGWAPFHYGRWTYDSYYGWIWVPGDEWGPAWVNWRSGGGYYGWAPLAPGISINVSFGNNYYTPYDWWTFIPCQHIYSPNYYSYWRGPRYNTTIINQTTIINNYYNNRYVYGPRRNEIERYTGGRVNIYNIRNEQRPGRTAIRRNEVALYRPQIVKTERANFREAPRNVVRAERPVGEAHNRDNRATSDRERAQRVIQNQPADHVNRLERNAERNEQPRERVYQDANRIQPERVSGRDDMMRAQREQEISQRSQRQNEQRREMERQRINQENSVRAQREIMAQRQNEQRMQMERQQRENMQRMQMERAQRDNEMRMQEMRNRQQMMEQRQQQMQMQRDQQQQRMQMERQQQREWRRPEPQQQMQRMERPQMERAQPSGGRERPFGRGR